MITIQTLESITRIELLHVFNLSFSDYVIPFKLTEEQLFAKLNSDSIDLGLSAGAFENGKLIAFILHGFNTIANKKIVYNAGTGVIPAKRGNQFTIKLYNFILPILQKAQIDTIQLEVITTNTIAIELYKKIGFTCSRKLICFKGLIGITKKLPGFEIRKMETYDWRKIHSFWDFIPSWQNSVIAVEKLFKTNVSLGVYSEDKLMGYLIYNPSLKRVHQFGVDKKFRRCGVGHQLFDYVLTNYSNEISIINIDEQSSATILFLTQLGLQQSVAQFEMELSLH